MNPPTVDRPPTVGYRGGHRNHRPQVAGARGQRRMPRTSVVDPIVADTEQPSAYVAQTPFETPIPYPYAPPTAYPYAGPNFEQNQKLDAWQPTPFEVAAPPRRSRKRIGLIIAGAVSVATVAAVVAVLSFGGGSSTPAAPKGYNDPGQLSQSVQDTYAADITADGGDASGLSVLCVAHPPAPHEFSCVLTNDGVSAQHLVTVSADGTQWVTST